MQTQQKIRPAAVSGSFYPDDKERLREQVQALLRAVKKIGPAPKAVIAPHAGYIYSGPVAASVYGLLRDSAAMITRVVLLGPSHRVPFYGIALSSATHYETPLGKIPVDEDVFSHIQQLPFVKILDEAHAHEHSLEVHLPFLQEILSGFVLVPLVVGEVAPAEVAQVLTLLWGGRETLIVVSSDLSHYHDYNTACSLDKETCAAIVGLAPERIGYDHACGRHPVCGLLATARQKNLSVSTVDLRNSGDTAGSKDRVVGYGAWAFS